MAKKNKAHVFDFTGILNAEINQQDWKAKKKLLEEQFGKFKMALDTDLAEAEAQKILDMFNEKLNLQLNVEQVKKDAEAVKKIIETALASINNIDTSALRGIEDTLKGIAETTSGIFDKLSENTQKASKKTIASVTAIDKALQKLGGDFTGVQEALDFEIKGGAEKQLEAVRKEQERLNEALKGDDWVEKQKALVRYTKAFESYQAKVKNNANKIPKELSDLYHANVGRASDAKINLQHIIDRHDQKWSGETSGGSVNVDTSKLATEDTLRKIANKLDNLKVNISGDNSSGDGGKKTPNSPNQTPIDDNNIDTVLQNAVTNLIDGIKMVGKKIQNKEFDEHVAQQYMDGLAESMGNHPKIAWSGDITGVMYEAIDNELEAGDIIKLLKPFASLKQASNMATADVQPSENNISSSIDESALGNVIANALKGVQLNANTQGEVKASIDATELKSVLHDGTPYDVRIVGEDGGSAPNNSETVAQEQLNKVKQESVDIYDFDILEEIKKETGTLEDKLERLQEVSDQWGLKITQRKRDRYEELNQKEMDSGLTTAEENRMSDLYEEISTADEALEEFGRTYDKIILKLANGKKVEIFPDDKGLGSLYKVGDEYGESYNGIEIEDVVFERKQEEIVENKKLAVTYDELKEKLEAYAKVKRQAVIKHYAGQDISDLAPTLRSMEEDIAQYFDKNNPEPTQTPSGYKMQLQDANFNPDNTLKAMCRTLGIEVPQAAEKAKVAIDETALTTVLQNVFNSILTPKSDTDEPWAKEGTLGEVKSVLESIKANTDKFVVDNADPRTETLKKEIGMLKTKHPNDLFEYEANQQLIADKENELNNLGDKSIDYTQLSAVFDNLQNVLNDITDAFKQSNISTTIVTVDNTLETLNNTLRGISRLVVVPTDIDGTSQSGVNSTKLTEGAGGIGKTKMVTNAAGKPTYRADTTVERTGNAVKTQTDIFGYDKQGNEVPKGTITVEDFDKFIKEQKSDAQKIKTAQAKLKEFLTQFNNKTLGKAEQVSGYSAVSDFLDPTKTTWDLDTIEKAKQGMLSLNAEFNKLSQNFRKGSSSLNPFVNAINNTEKLESQIQNIQLDFTALKNAPDELYTTVDGLQDDFTNVMSLKDGNDIEAYSLAYGNLREKIVKVVNEIRILRKEQGITQKSALFDENKEVIGVRSNTQVQEWERMSYIPDELRDKFRLLHSELNNVVDQDELNIWKKQWEQIRVQITALRREHQGMEADLKEVLTIYEEIGRNEAKIEGLQSEGEKDVYRKRNLALEEEAKELAKIYGLNVDLAAIEKARADAKKSGMVRVDAAQERKTLNERIKAERKAARINASNTNWNAGKRTLESLWKLDDDDIKVNQIPAVKQLDAALEDLTAAQKRADDAIRNNTADEKDAIANLKIHSHKVAGLTAEVKELISNYERFSGANATELGDFAGGDWEQQVIAAIEAQYPGARIKSINHDLQEVTYELKTGARAFTEYTAGVRQADQKMMALKGTTKKLPTFLDGVKKKLGEISQYFSAMSLISRATQELRKGIQYIKEIDLALTELKKVTDETEETYDKFLDTAAKTGERLGTPISAVIEATATFAKLGYSMKQASEMAEAAIVYKNVGDGIASTEDAADSIISTLKGFGMEASETMRIVDRFNEVGNRFAITSKGIGEALRLSASALSEGGNSLDESIALITAANEVVRFMPHSHSNMVI